MSEKVAGIILDCETTGLNAGQDFILELGMMAVNQRLEVVSTFETLVYSVPTAHRIRQIKHVAAENPDSGAAIVCEMHNKSGLFMDLHSKPYLSPQEASEWALQWLHSACSLKPEELPLCGSTIEFDRGFLVRHMPTLDEFFHYRTVNASGFKEFEKHFAPNYVQRTGPRPEKREIHRVLADCEDSRRLLRWTAEEFYW